MFVSALLPFVDRGSGPLYHWVMLAQMARFEPGELAFIGDQAYFDEDVVPFDEWIKVGGLRLRCPTRERFREFKKVALDGTLFEGLTRRIGRNQLAIFRHLLTHVDAEVAKCLAQVIQDVCAGEELEAVLTWCNFPSLREALASFGDVPIIHNEIGPLRAPLYRDTIYFDFSGVNGLTSPPAWDESWVKGQMAESDLLSLDTLRGLMVSDLGHVAEINRKRASYRAGVVLQVEDDSNVVAYSQGWSQLDLLYDAMGRFGPERVTVRSHPGARFVYRGGLGHADESPDSLAFLAEVDEIFSVNSSVLVEAAFWERRFDLKGDSPLRFLQPVQHQEDVAWKLLAWNAFFLAYLVPAELLFDPEYYRWRLTRPTLAECHRRHAQILSTRESVVPVFGFSKADLRDDEGQGSLVRLPAVWTSTLSLERQLATAAQSLLQTINKASVREAELLAQLSQSRDAAQRWEIEAKENWKEMEHHAQLAERRGEQVEQLTEQLSQFSQREQQAKAAAEEARSNHEQAMNEMGQVRQSLVQSLSSLSDVRSELAQARAELHSASAVKEELSALLADARDEEEQARGLLVQTRRALDEVQLKHEQQLANHAQILGVLSELANWIEKLSDAHAETVISEQSNGAVATLAAPSVTMDAGAGLHESSFESQSVHTSAEAVEENSPELEGISVAEGRSSLHDQDVLRTLHFIFSSVINVGAEEAGSVSSGAAQPTSPLSGSERESLLSWQAAASQAEVLSHLESSLEVLYAELVRYKRSHYHVTQACSRLESGLERASSILADALEAPAGRSEVEDPQVAIEELARGAAASMLKLRLELAHLQSRRKTFFENIRRILISEKDA